MFGQVVEVVKDVKVFGRASSFLFHTRLSQRGNREKSQKDNIMKRIRMSGGMSNSEAMPLCGLLYYEIFSHFDNSYFERHFRTS